MIRNFILLFVVLTLSVRTGAQPSSEIKLLSSKEFYQIMHLLPYKIVIDARDSASFVESRISTALLVATKEQLSQMMDTLELETPLLIYCEEGKRSLAASKMLIDKGFKNVMNLERGFRVWKTDSLPVDHSLINFTK